MIVWRCDACGEAVDDGAGWITVDLAAAARYEEAHARWEAEIKAANGGLLLISGPAWSTMPRKVRWRVVHDRCDPTPERKSYWFGVGRARTHTQLLDWALHLSSKNWLRATDWDQFIYRRVPGVAWAS